MSQREITQIKIGKNRIGLVGLKAVLEETAQTHAGKPYEEISTELLTRLSKANYIPDQVKNLYGEAFLREFKKVIGEPIEDESDEGITIKILGPGCTRCEGLERAVIGVLSEMKLEADVEHVRDIKEIGKYGIMGMPGLVINGKVVAVGTVPPKTKIQDWLAEYLRGDKAKEFINNK